MNRITGDKLVLSGIIMVGAVFAFVASVKYGPLEYTFLHFNHNILNNLGLGFVVFSFSLMEIGFLKKIVERVRKNKKAV